MYIDSLVLETTRKCNLKCSHCLRGAAQRLTMTNEIMANTMRDVDGIGCLCFTGGEPSLAPEVFELFFDYWLWKRPDISSVYIVSNGQPHNRYGRFLKAVDRLMSIADDSESCSLEISQDQFHPKSKIDCLFEKYMPEKYLYEAPEWFRPKKRTTYISEPLNEGLAKKTGVGIRQPEEQKPWVILEESINTEDVYISSNGNVTSCCNLSYKRIDTEYKGNILKQDLKEILNSYSESFAAATEKFRHDCEQITEYIV